MKDLFKLLVYTFALFFAVNSGNILIVGLICVFSIFYIIRDKNIKLNLKSENSCVEDDFKGHMIDTISHDLKIPALAQLRCLEQLTNGYYGELKVSQKSVIKELENSSKSLINIIEMLVSSYNLDNKNFKLNYEKCNLLEILTISISKVKEMAQEKDIKFEYSGVDGNVYILADKKELERTILNLLFNAINQSLNGNKIKVTVNNHNNKLSFNISGKFLDGFEASQYSTIGKNISMQFCKKIIELHDGKIYCWKDNDLKQNIAFVIPQKPSNVNAF